MEPDFIQPSPSSPLTYAVSQDEVVAISPQWLADAMARVVSFSSGPRVPDGILDHSTLSALWPATITDAVTGEERVLAPDPVMRQALLELVHRFGVALQLENKDGSLQTRSLVPGVLKPIKKPKHHEVAWRKATAAHQVLGMVATLDFVPHNLVPELLLRAYRYAPPGDSAVGWRWLSWVLACVFALFVFTYCLSVELL